VTDERLIIAIGRLDQALTRLESLAAQAERTPPGMEVEQLRQRHARLRDRTREAVDALDRLIGSA
jgi:hypothetical protein